MKVFVITIGILWMALGERNSADLDGLRSTGAEGAGV